MKPIINQRAPASAAGSGTAASARRSRKPAEAPATLPHLPLIFVPEGASHASRRTLVVNLAPRVTAHLENDRPGLAVLNSMIRALQTYPAKEFAVFTDHLVFQFPHEESGQRRGFDCYCSFDADLPSGIGTISVFAQQEPGHAQEARETTPELYFRLDFARAERPMSEWTSVRVESAKKVPTLYPLAGNKRTIFEGLPTVTEPILKGMNAPGTTSFVDAFAGTGYVSFWAAAQIADGAASADLDRHLNELDPYRHLALEVVQKYPEQLKQSLSRHREQLLYLYYRVLNDIPIESFRIDALERDQERLADHILIQDGLAPAGREPAAKMKYMKAKLDDWVDDEPIDQARNARLTAALKDFILSNVTLDLPAESEAPDESEIARRADQAVLYLLAQLNNRIETLPVNFHRATRPNRHWTQVTAGAATILNKLVSRSKMLRTGGAGRLLLGNTELIATNKNVQLALPATIDRASAALRGVRITCGDGWELLKSLKRGAFAVVDPPYVTKADRRRAGVRYSRGPLVEYSETGFLQKWAQHAVPAWEENARFVLFNRWSPSLAQGLTAMGLKVDRLEPQRVVQNQSRLEGLVELMATNFNPDAAATLRPYRSHPDPELLLSAAEEEGNDSQSPESKRRKTIHDTKAESTGG